MCTLQCVLLILIAAVLLRCDCKHVWYIDPRFQIDVSLLVGGGLVLLALATIKSHTYKRGR